MWSWHIWLTDYNPRLAHDACKTASPGHPNPLVMMKYNLGATDTGGKFTCITRAYRQGFHYQWGRKDPFPGGAGEKADCRAGQQYYYNVKGGIGDFNYSKAGGSLVLGYQHPMNFYISTAFPYDWQGKTVRQDLWGNPGMKWKGNVNAESGMKTCFDPCPPGWKVPPRGTWSKASVTGTEKGCFFYGNTSGSGEAAFYPATGYRYYFQGALMDVGTHGYYWCSSPSSESATNAGFMSFYGGQLNALYSGSRAYGLAVRCARNESRNSYIRKNP